MNLIIPWKKKKKPMLYSRFLSCYQISFFCSRTPHYIWVSPTFDSPRLWPFLQLSLFSVTLTVLSSTGEVFCWLSFSFRFSDVFLMVRLEIRVTGRGPQRQSATSISGYQGCMWSALSLITDVGLGHLTEVVSVRFLHCRPAHFPPPRVLFRRKSLYTARTEGVGT